MFKREVKMQADNLRPQDVKRIEELFKQEIMPENPKATLSTFLRKKFNKKDCLFRDRCKK